MSGLEMRLTKLARREIKNSSGRREGAADICMDQPPTESPPPGKKTRKPRHWRMITLLVLIGGLVVLGFITVRFVLPWRCQVPLGPNDRQVAVFGANLRYREHPGTGTPLLFLHGFGSSVDSWSEVVAGVPDRHWYALDMVGFGGSDRPALPYDLECQRKYVLEFMDQVGLQQPVVVGHSMGASVAAWLAAQNPERVAATVLIAPSAYPESLHFRFPLNLIHQPGGLNRVASAIFGSAPFRRLFPCSLAAPAIRLSASYDERFAQALPRIQQPTHLIWSQSDKQALFAFHDKYLAAIPHCVFQEAPATAGHGIPKTAPAIVLTAIQEITAPVVPAGGER